MGTLSKAHAGGFAGALTVLLQYFADMIPLVATMPPEPKMALTFLLSGAVGWLLVYLAPANTPRREEAGV